jgi:hypothetical protein
MQLVEQQLPAKFQRLLTLDHPQPVPTLLLAEQHNVALHWHVRVRTLTYP